MSPFNKSFKSAGPKKTFGSASRGSARPPSRGYSSSPSSTYSSRPKSGGFSAGGYRGGSSAGGSYRGASTTGTSSRGSFAPSASGYRGASTASAGGYRGSRPTTGGYQGSRSSGGTTSHYSRGRSFGGAGHRGGGNRGGGKSERIDFNRFINKAVITESTEHFKPEHTFADFKIDEALKAAVIAKGYKLPSPIQDRSIPHILQGSDIVGIANTGTGKTAAFLIPLINKVRLNPKEQVIVISPTRELSIQIDDELKSFVKGMKIFSVCCVGGAPIGKQIRDLQYQYNFVIGTPGRLKDLIDRKLIKLAEFQTVVLDEADRMLDMGFINDMRAIMQGMPKDRHTLFFSATLSPDIEKIIKDFLKDPVRISVKTQDTSKNVDQDVVHIKAGETKIDTLKKLLSQAEFSKVLIFGRTKHGVERISKDLMAKGFKAESIHGNKNHSQRQRALKTFKDNNLQVLVATDVAARGLDIADVTHVINYDIPATYDDYVHRIGRTGRGNKKGKALTFIGGDR